MFPFLQSLSAADMTRLRDRVPAELTTTFASHFDEEMSLARLLASDVVAVYVAGAGGRKFLINPTLDAD